MFKSIVPTKDSQFPQLPKCFEMEFGPQKSRVLVPLYPLLSLSRLGGGDGGGVPIFPFGQERGLWKNSAWYGGDLKKFCPFKNTQKELEIPGVKEFSEWRRALRKNPFQGKMWIFSGTTQWIYLLLKGKGGGGWKKGVKLFLTGNYGN